ncbi:hypothetical protein C3K47_07880 [Solitalea longa]|uniref:YggT family protein n=1 Tax=Solitalea longa TaxID=2079460 RepID=A0A2S5A325_9SPHI|nr:hypothetical protein C3K47_07880 [Solitalea longa]
MKLMLFLIISFLIVGLFLYSKLLPHKDRLDKQYKGLFNFCNSIFSPLLNFLRSIIKPMKVGQGLAVDMAQLILLILFLILIKIL